MNIKFKKYYVTNGETKYRVSYMIGNRIDGRECVNIYAKDLDRSLGKIFKDIYVNETETMTDYFDQGRGVTLFADHPLYANALIVAKNKSL
jgi:hypothetical protein